MATLFQLNNQFRRRLQSEIIHLPGVLGTCCISVLLLAAGCGGEEDDFGPTANFDSVNKGEATAKNDDNISDPVAPKLDPTAKAEKEAAGPDDAVTPNPAEEKAKDQTIEKGETPATVELDSDALPQVDNLEVSGYLARSDQENAVFAGVSGHELVLINQYTGQVASRFSQSGEHQVSTVAISTDGSLTIVGLQDGSVKAFSSVDTSSFDIHAKRMLKAAQRESVGTNGHDGAVTHAVVFPGNQEAATAGADGTVHIWSVRTEGLQQVVLHPVRSFPAHPSELIALRLLSGGRLLSVGANGQIRLWSIKDPEAVPLEVAIIKTPVSAITIGADETTIAAALNDGSVQLMQLDENGEVKSDKANQAGKSGEEQLKNRRQLEEEAVIAHPTRVRCIALSADSQMVMTGCDDGIVRIWDVKTSKMLEQTKPEKSEIIAIGFPSNTAPRRYATSIFSMHASGVLQWFQSDASPLETHRTRVLNRTVARIELAGMTSLSDSGEKKTSETAVTTREAQQVLQLCDKLRTSSTAKEIAANREAILKVASSPEDKPNATAELPGLVSTFQSDFDFQSGNRSEPSPGNVKLVFSIDGTRLIAVRKESEIRTMPQTTIHVWDSPTGLELRHWKNPGIGLEQFQAVGNGLNLVTLPDNAVLQVSTGFRELLKPEREVLMVVRSPDGRYFATGEPGEELKSSAVIRLYDAHSMQQTAAFEAYESYVTALAFSPDGSTLVAGVRGKKAHRLLALEAKTLKSIQLIEEQEHDETWLKSNRIVGKKGITQIIFSQDGRRLLTYGDYRRGEYRVSIWGTKNSGWVEENELRVASRTALLLPTVDPPAQFLDSRGRRLIIATKTGYSILDLDEQKQEREIKLTPPPAESGLTTISPDGSLLAMGTEQGKIQLWQLGRDKPMKDFQAHLGPVVALKFSPDGTHFATAGEENAVHIWKLSDWPGQSRRLAGN